MKMTRTFLPLLLAFILTVLVAGCIGAAKASDDTTWYTDLIFDTTRVHTIEVTMSEEDRADQLAHPTDKTKYTADVVIDGEKVEGVTFHTKGNSSLFFTANAGRDKFSYAIKFGSYAKGKSFHGLDRLDLQNGFTDASLTKEYLSYWLFRRMGVDAPLASYAWLTINGEDQGLFTALEDINDSFLARTAGGEGTIYKPEAEGLALNDEELERLTAGGIAAHDGGGGADLVYRGDDEQAYQDIFENAQTDEDDQTRARVIEALRALSEGTDLEAHLFTDEIIRYFAVHNFLVNYDSYTGPMLHNYCLYERDGRLAMLPWDYSAAFGSFPPDARVGADIDSAAAVNAGIDSPLGSVADEARPMWNWILRDEKYLAEYHDALLELLDVFESGEFEAEAARVYDLIFPYIEKDPKAFFASDKSKIAFETMIEVSRLRAESVRRQLEGMLASKSELQAEESRVDASGVSIRDMGASKDI